MFKRTIAFYLILFAKIILMAHAFVPHHHHKSEVCIVNTHCQSDNDSNKHIDVDHNHEHDRKSNQENCFLKEVVVIPSNRLIKEFNSLDWADNHLKFNLFQSVLTNNGFESITPFFILNLQQTQSVSKYLFFATRALGLRAPPTA